jgi:hypothetical protein
MVRVFGLLVALAMSTGAANAALLVTWDFNSNASGSAASGFDLTATDFSNFGSVDGKSGNDGALSSNTWLTSSINKDPAVDPADLTKGNGFSVTNTSVPPGTELVLQSLAFNAQTLPVPNTLFSVNSATITLFGRSNGVGAFEELSSATVSPTTTALSTMFFNKSLLAGDSYEFQFSYTGLAFTGASVMTGVQTPVQIRFDNLTLNGTESVVPEPASMACFAGLFAVGAFRSLRKRS